MNKKRDKQYVRVSTKYDTQKDSPEHQEAFIREMAGYEGIEFGPDDIYMDRDTATSIMDREDVQKLIKDATRGEVRSVWFASLSRFSRDTLDALSLKRTIVNALKVRLVSIEDGYDSAKKDDEVLFGVKSVINQNQSEQISVSSRRGIRQSAAKGNYIGSIPPYGYRKVKIDGRKTLEIVPEQARIVRMIFALYVNHGLGEKAIVNYLNGGNERGEVFPSYKGGPWGLSSVQRILQNENYTGYNVYGRHTVEVTYNDLSNLMDRGKKLVQKPKDAWERTDFQTHEAIITRELFQQAQEIRLLRGGGERGGRRSFVNVFAKMIFCAECGSAMVSMGSKHSNGVEYRYLMCSRRRRTGEAGCSNNKWIPYYEMRDELIGEVLRRLRERLAEIESGKVSARVPSNDREKEKRKLEKRIDDNRKLLFEIRRQNMLGELDKAQYDFEREQYEKEIEEADKKLALIVAEERRTIDTDRIAKEAHKAVKVLTELSSYDDVEKVRPLLMQCVKRIDVHHDGEVEIQTYI
ncbi:recombinase family protein [Cohnella lubricantis]|uniref:Recombinase family protein n=1 Tax=Cohnella lubricantis TaxID=2163172 RepID=A0A841T934_9BACL|nr:recombinase family protein [Cohnella lubricantis]MBB6675938.1 recombinase family protein [Cohnella lubricantis]MBP2117946.1 DNA invertase Pin-like site-specific DNA recombinase [Cohnella lubricantis]